MGDNLDITSQQTLADAADIAEPAVKLHDQAVPVPAAQINSEGDDGLSLGQKLFFIGAIVAVCALFIRSARGRPSGFKPKSMA